MNFQVASDLHLDQLEKFEYIEDYSSIIFPNSDILILAGDICHIENSKKYFKFFSYLNDNFHYIIYIPGNHEYYNKNSLKIEDLDESMKFFLRSYQNFIYLNNNSVMIEGYLFTGSTLWCNPTINPPPWFNINITKEDISNMNKDSINYLKKISSIKYDKHIIITHYPPLNIDLKFKKKDKDIYKEYYINEDLFLESPPKYWIFGHTHNNFNKVINNTIYISNQRKDKRYNNHLTFRNL
jgi:predicted phosphohydrolase